jgi:hypothetical protein
MKPLGTIPQWNPTLAYAIGLITTDGSLSSNGRTIDFTSKDRELVQTFKRCLNRKNKIGKKARANEKVKRYYRVQVGDIIFYRWLLSIGLMPNKSKRIKKLTIPDKYFADFLRGHLDGDGSIRVYQDPVWKNSQRLYVVFTSASMAHLQWLHDRIDTLVGIKGFIRANLRVYSLTYSKRASLQLLPYLYHSQNIPCLERKYKIANSILERYAEVAKLGNA